MPGADVVVLDRRLTVACVLSTLVHVAALATIWRSMPTVTKKAVPIPVALIGRFGGGGGAAGAPAGPAVAEPVVQPAPPPPAVASPTRRKPKPTGPMVAKVAPPVEAQPAPSGTGATSAAPEGNGVGGGGSGGGGGQGDGTGGDGSGGAHVAYGANPLPPYPMVARRLGKEGVVLLDVLVAADGSPAEVQVARTSGFAPLDESAVATVRSRWRFVPASRDGVPYASRVTVPIRFRLDRTDRG